MTQCLTVLHFFYSDDAGCYSVQTVDVSAMRDVWCYS